MRRTFTTLFALFALLAIGLPAAAQNTGLAPADIERIARSVVYIENYQGGQAVTSGSGTIIESSGLIYTNHHVVEGGDDFSISMTLETGELPVLVGWATVVQAYNEIDFAILQIDRGPDRSPIDPTTLNLPTLSEGVREVSLGDRVWVFGYPTVGDGYLIVTQGSITSVEKSDVFGQRVPMWYRTDAEISPGNSGGLVVDSLGRYLGLPTAVRSEERTLGRLGGVLPYVAVETVLAAYATGRVPDTTTLTVSNQSTSEICYVYISSSNASSWGEDQLGQNNTIPAGRSFNFTVEPGVYDVLLQDCARTELADLRDREMTESVTLYYPIESAPGGSGEVLSISITDVEYDVAVDDGGPLGIRVHTEIVATGYQGVNLRAAVFFYNTDGTPVSCENMTDDYCDPNNGITVQTVLTPTFGDTIWDDYWFWIPYIGFPDGLTRAVDFTVQGNIDVDGSGTMTHPSAEVPFRINFGSGLSAPPASDFTIEITKIEFNVAGDRSLEDGVRTYVNFTADGYREQEVRVAVFFFWADGTPIPCPQSDQYYCDPEGGLTVQEVVTPTYDSSEWTDYWMHIPYEAFPVGLTGTQSGYTVAYIGANDGSTMTTFSSRFAFDLFYN